MTLTYAICYIVDVLLLLPCCNLLSDDGEGWA